MTLLCAALFLTAAVPVNAPRARLARPAAVVVCANAAAQEEEPEQEQDDSPFEALLAALDEELDDDTSIERLAQLGVDLPRLVLAWHRPSDDAPSGRALDERQWSRIERAAERVSRRPLQQVLESELAGVDPAPVALAALRLLGRIGSSAQAELLIELLVELDAERPGRGESSAIALSSFAAIQRRDKQLAGELGARVASFPKLWLGLVARELAAIAAHEEDLDLVWTALSAELAQDAMLSVLVQVAPNYVYRVDERRLGPLRRRMRSADTRTAEMAIQALSSLGDGSIVEQLIAFLTQSDPRINRAAAHGLRTLTGLPYGTDVDRWEHWHTESLTWWHEHGATLADDLRWSDAKEATRLVVEIARQRLHRAELVDALIQTFERSDEEVVDLAILCLRELRWGGTSRRLIDTLDSHPSAQVQAYAWRALRTLTGLDAGPDAEAWRLALLL